mmetsp:Transcript_129932/g.417009  ORF Transcript_129932/g.417009 Transcript_129932/m.417009 type:complete len:249 (-) Transcript_129932:388-1134(-)
MAPTAIQGCGVRGHCSSNPCCRCRTDRGLPRKRPCTSQSCRLCRSTAGRARHSTRMHGNPCRSGRRSRRPNQRPFPAPGPDGAQAWAASCRGSRSSNPWSRAASGRTSRGRRRRRCPSCSTACQRRHSTQNSCNLRSWQHRSTTPRVRRPACGAREPCKSTVWSLSHRDPRPGCNRPCTCQNPLRPSRSTACRNPCSTGMNCNPRRQSSRIQAGSQRCAHRAARSSICPRPGCGGPGPGCRPPCTRPS